MEGNEPQQRHLPQEAHESRSEAALPEPRWGPGWRFLMFLVLLVVSLVAVTVVGSLFFHEPTMAAEVGLLTATTVLATWVAMRFLERRPFVTVGLRWRAESATESAGGLALGALLVAGMTVLAWAAGAIRFQLSGVSLSDALLQLGPVTILMVVAAATEELLFRGYQFQRLSDASNTWIAVAVISIEFGILHAGNPNATTLSSFNTALAGVMLSLAYVRTRALWLPISLHFAWNWSLLLLGYPVSGVEIARVPWEAAPISDAVWLHGGNYGPEGGIMATVALALGSIYLGHGVRTAAVGGCSDSIPAESP